MIFWKERPLPQLPSIPPLGWKHVAGRRCAAESQMPIAILAQGESLESSRVVLRPVFKHQKKASTCKTQQTICITVWKRWWCLTTRFLGLTFQRKSWGVIASYFKGEKALERTDLRIARLRKNWSRQGRILDAIMARGRA